MKTKAKAIRRLNDKMRAGQVTNGMLVVTNGIASLCDEAFVTIHNAVMQFDNFTEDNDPYGEHDFGSFVYQNHKVYWKIDYYNPDLSAGQGNRVKNELTAKTPDFLFLRARITDLGSMPVLEMHPLRVIFDCFHRKHSNIAPEIRSPDYPGQQAQKTHLTRQKPVEF